MKWILIFLTVGMLRAGGDEPYWQPYDFKGTERFEYTISQEEGGKTTEGRYVLDLSRDGDQYVLTVEGKFAGNEGKSTVRVNSAEEIQGQLMAQMFFNPWLAPISLTLFAQSFAMLPFMGMGSEPGSRMSRKNEDGETVELRVETCTFQGREGRKFVSKVNGEVNYASCVVKGIALPVEIFMADDEDGTTYAAKLVKYSE